MNNPLRYAGETFYQSGYSGPTEAAVESTTHRLTGDRTEVRRLAVLAALDGAIGRLRG